MLTVGGASYDVFREGAFSGRFVLESNGTELASAEKPSAFHRSFTVPFGGKSFRLEAEDAFKRTFLVLEQDRQVGAIVPEGIFTRRATADLPDDMPLPVQAFLIWLTVILWKRDADAGTAAAAAAVTG